MAKKPGTEAVFFRGQKKGAGAQGNAAGTELADRGQGLTFCHFVFFDWLWEILKMPQFYSRASVRGRPTE